MNSINPSNNSDIQLESAKKNNFLKTIGEGERFETYIGWAFAKALDCTSYSLRTKYSFNFEKDRLNEIIKKLYQNESEKNSEQKKIKKKIEDFINENKNLCNKESESSKSSLSNKDIIPSKIKNDKNEKNKVDIKGDFDVIIPNINKDSFLKILENNFYSKKAYKCIVYDEEKIKQLPPYFNLFIEVGINSFENTSYMHKIKQINKYISILNFADNIIENKTVREYYKNDFIKRYNLNLNANDHKIADKSVYMLVANKSYGEFTSRFLDNRNSLNINKNDELNSIISKTSKEILLCGFVDFPKIINNYKNNELLVKQIEEQKKEIDEQKEKMQRMESELDYLKSLIQNNHTGYSNNQSTSNVDMFNNMNYYGQYNDDNYRNDFYFGYNNYNNDNNDYYSYNYQHYFGNNHYFNNYYHY